MGDINIIHSAVGSTVIVGCECRDINATTQTNLSEFAAEAARIVEKLSLRDKVIALSYLYALEDGKHVPHVKV